MQGTVQNQDRQQLRFEDVVKINLKWKESTSDEWQSKAMDHHSWRTVLNQKPGTVIVVNRQTALMMTIMIMKKLNVILSKKTISE